ncbi:hypothetical protein PV08_08477 [Exophiala spinifera]|uniref:Uncharacterized protein n=1 Tax=Exophiala spinifera TaxID=91928 RepID=A0A0D2BQ83_9EURO|nr:uncharacterized protein PV08_08477 [Exophiala spinifera]KIW13289.1 hypothetical protein PV08_08477 [Exophiala spinifera]
MAHAHSHPIPHDLFTQETPPSPVLTNPDMILPYRPLENPSPIPLASSPILLTSSPPARPDSAVSLTSPDVEVSTGSGVATAVRMPPPMVTPIDTSYHGYEHGAPLSDIGEEETPISRRSRATDYFAQSDPPSPTPGGANTRQLRRLSTQSSSSIGSDLGDWENFDTSKIMNERLAADVAKVPDEKVEGGDSKRNSIVGISAEDEVALLNERAEKILAQARKRLTNMEDNLSKARHSVLLSSRSSPNINELHQPAGGLYRSISLAGASSRKPRLLTQVTRAHSTHSRGGSDTAINGGLKRLSMIAEVRSASALEYGLRQESPQQVDSSPQPRFEGASPASFHSHNSTLRALEEEEGEGTPSTIKTSPESFGPRGLGINTLASISREDVSVLPSSPSTAIARSPSQMSSRSTKEIREQISDLRSKISELKEKAQADSLRRRSIQSIRTPSPFTNARTPEQWYTSAPEYKEAGSPLNTNAGLGWSPSQHKSPVEIQVTPVTPQEQKFQDIDQPATDESKLNSAVKTDKNTPSLHKSVNVLSPLVGESGSIIQESCYEDAAQTLDDEEPIAASEEEQIYLNEVLQESLEEFEPDVPDLPEHILASEQAAGRHEDRYDAFDYENMFLHSTLGNYTGTGTRSETPSESDTSSLRTTRAEQNTPPAEDDEDEEQAYPESADEERSGTPTPVVDKFSQHLSQAPPMAYMRAPSIPWTKNVRSNSMDSVSTSATFATATEGDGPEESQGDDGLPTDILTWGPGTGISQLPKSSGVERTPPVWPTPPMGGRASQPETGSTQKIRQRVTVVTNGIPTPPTQSPSMVSTVSAASTGHQNPPPNAAMIDHPANTEILMESLIKLAHPDFTIADGQRSTSFADVDKDLVLDLLRAVGGICNQILEAEKQHEMHAAKVLRRRLDASRRLLEGQSDNGPGPRELFDAGNMGGV